MNTHVQSITMIVFAKQRRHFICTEQKQKKVHAWINWKCFFLHLVVFLAFLAVNLLQDVWGDVMFYYFY